MEFCLKLTTGLVLLIQAFQPMLLQNTTDLPGRTIDKSWFREPSNNALGSQTPNVEQPAARDQELDSISSTDDDMNGSLDGSMVFSGGEDVENQEHNINGTYDGMTVVTTPMLPMFPNETDTEANVPSTPAAPKAESTTQLHQNSSVNNGSNAEGEFQDSTMVLSNYTDQRTSNSSTSPKSSNVTDLEETTLAPETHETNDTSGETDLENWLSPNNTEETTSSKPNISYTAAPENGTAPSAPLPTTTITTTESPHPETTVDETVPVTMTTIVPGTTEESNMTDRNAAAAGSNTEKGLATSSKRSKRNEAWAAILGTAVAVCVIALVVYVILKKKNQKDFSHRKLVEFSSDPG
ncbi:unnamed protein product [Merluccius merluccius]